MEKQYTKHITEYGTTISYGQNGVRYSFPEKPGNRFYEEYLAWIAEGNEPEVINDQS